MSRHVGLFHATAAKADEAARKRKEKAELLAAEEATQGSVKPKKAPALSKKKGKKKNDLSLLEDALVGEAEKKTKAKKRAELLKKEKEMEAKKKAAAAAVAAGTGTSVLGGQAVDPLMHNTDAMLSSAVGREANKQAMESASGLDAALDSLDVNVGTDVKRRKALFLAFEERMLPVVKEEHPGLRLTQYKDKVFNLWKKSPENPANQPGP